MKQSIGEFLATLRKAHGYTQQEVADRLSVSNRTVSAWERGTVLPDILLLPALAELYGVTADEILAGERNAEAAPRPALSEKSERKLLKKKMNAFFTRSLILFGVYATGLLLFFIGLFVDFTTVTWVGWQWWLLLIILGLVVFLVCAVCILALWRGTENSADEESEGYGVFCLLLRRRVALLSDLSAGMSLLFGGACGFSIFAGTVRGTAFAVAAVLFFLFAVGKFSFGVLLVRRAEKQFGGEEGAQIAARNAKRYRKCALFCLIPVLAGAFVLVLFGLWHPETRVPVFEAALDDFTADMETLVEVREGESMSVEYTFDLTALSKTAVEGESYDLGNGFTCTFQDDMETCCIKSRYVLNFGFYNGIGNTFFFHRLHAEGGEFSVYNVRYGGYNDGTIHAVDWKGDIVYQWLRLEADETRAKLSQCYREDYFPLAAPLAIFGMTAGVGVCILVCAIKRERLKVKL